MSILTQFIANELDKKAKQQDRQNKLTQMLVTLTAIQGGPNAGKALTKLKPQIEEAYGKDSFDMVQQGVISGNFLAQMGLGRQQGQATQQTPQAPALPGASPEDYGASPEAMQQMPQPTRMPTQRALPTPKRDVWRPSISAEGGVSLRTESIENPEYAEERTARLHQLNDIFEAKLRDNPDKTNDPRTILTFWEDSLDEFNAEQGFYPTAKELEDFSPPEVKGALQISQDQLVKQNEWAAKLRTEFEQDSNNFVIIRDAYDRIISAARDIQGGTAAGDLALIFSYMKILDPTSVVREGEFANAQNAAGVPDRIRNIWNRFLKGTRLGDEQRRDFLTRAEEMYEVAKRGQQKLVDEYTRISEVTGVDSRRVIIDYMYKMGKPMLPDGIPEDAVFLGTDRKTGKKIWQTPNGKKYAE